MHRSILKLRPLALVATAVTLGACASSGGTVVAVAPEMTTAGPPTPDPRVGLRAGVADAGQALWNMRLVSNTPKPDPFDATNSDLAFKGNYAIQGNYNGFLVWDISNPRNPVLRKGYFCPASQSDVSVYGDLLFVSGEGTGGRLDCGGEGVSDPVSQERLRGIRIFDISDLDNPVNVGNVQTCRGSHTHTVLKDPNDDANVYIYVSGSARVRAADELPGCSSDRPEDDPNSALFRIEVIRVPLANPAAAAIVSSPRIFNDLVAPPRHGEAPADIRAREAREQQALAQARARGGFIVEVQGERRVMPDRVINPMLDSIVTARGGSGAPTSADSAALRQALPSIAAQLFGAPNVGATRERTGPDQCHDITVYPAVGLAGGACEGYGLLLDIRDPVNPRRIDAVADSNFSYWHSATFNNAGTKVLFSDEWGGGGGAKCRVDDPTAWGADAIFTIDDGEMEFQRYYKLPAPQTEVENCVAHNGSMIPIPGRDIMVQAWYQGGMSVFDWTDPTNPYEIAFFDRGPLDAERMSSGGPWSVYWYNGYLVSSEIARGLDILELTPNGWLTQNEIDAANTVHLDYLNAQGQPQYVWPASFALARAYTDQLNRSRGLSMAQLGEVYGALAAAENGSGSLSALASRIGGWASSSSDAAKVRLLADAVRDLAEMQ